MYRYVCTHTGILNNWFDLIPSNADLVVQQVFLFFFLLFFCSLFSHPFQRRPCRATFFIFYFYLFILLFLVFSYLIFSSPRTPTLSCCASAVFTIRAINATKTVRTEQLHPVVGSARFSLHVQHDGKNRARTRAAAFFCFFFQSLIFMIYICTHTGVQIGVREWQKLCVCVCVGEREREREHMHIYRGPHWWSRMAEAACVLRKTVYRYIPLYTEIYKHTQGATLVLDKGKIYISVYNIYISVYNGIYTNRGPHWCWTMAKRYTNSRTRVSWYCVCVSCTI